MDSEAKQGLGEEEVIQRLKNLTLQDVPPGMTTRIMLQIEKSPEGALSRFLKAVNQPLTISFRPLHACALIAVLCASFMLGRVIDESEAPVWSSNPASLDGLFDPGDAQTPYLIGRKLLEADRGEQALVLLQKAAALEPANPEYAYWEGIGYWSTGNRLEERNSYIRGLAASPESIPLLMNLGHSLLSEGKYEMALDTYQSILALEPNQPTARYNSGLVQRLLERTDEEIESWRGFLELNRSGKRAFRAIDHLNNYGDFSYRAYLVGARKIIVSPERLFNEEIPAEQRQRELADVAEMLDRTSQLEIEVAVFTEHDIELARERALTIRNMLDQITESDTTGRIGVSWFDSPETVMTRQGSREISKGLLIFNRTAAATREELSI